MTPTGREQECHLTKTSIKALEQEEHQVYKFIHPYGSRPRGK
jgi:hypothetical protein